MDNMIKEIERLIKHYKIEAKELIDRPTGEAYSLGIVYGLEMALGILKDKEFYDKTEK